VCDLDSSNEPTEILSCVLGPGITKFLATPLNVMQLYAICVEEELIYVGTELMGNGNLRDYLQNDGRTLQLSQLGAQVAAGIAYLEKNTCIHGNLAAKGIFVSHHLIFRIGNIGIINALSEETSKELIRFKTISGQLQKF